MLIGAQRVRNAKGELRFLFDACLAVDRTEDTQNVKHVLAKAQKEECSATQSLCSCTTQHHSHITLKRSHNSTAEYMYRSALLAVRGKHALIEPKQRFCCTPTFDLVPTVNLEVLVDVIRMGNRVDRGTVSVIVL